MFKSGDGGHLEGDAAFHENGATGLRYEVRLAADYSTLGATIEGHRSGRAFRHQFRRDGGEWVFDGRTASGRDNLIHLDFGFTPATNLQQLRHARLAVREEAEIAAAWFDIGESALVRLPQRYRRVAADR